MSDITGLIPYITFVLVKYYFGKHPKVTCNSVEGRGYYITLNYE